MGASFRFLITLAVVILMLGQEAFAQRDRSAAGARRTQGNSSSERSSLDTDKPASKAASENRRGTNTDQANAKPGPELFNPGNANNLYIDCADQEFNVDSEDQGFVTLAFNVEVKAQSSAWQMALVSQDLKSPQGRVIPSSRLSVMTGNTEGTPLGSNRAAPIVLDGPKGVTTIEVTIRLEVPPDFDAGAEEYEGGMVLIGARCFGDPRPILKCFRFKLRFCQKIRHEYVNTKNYLHFGNTQSPQQFQVIGTITSRMAVRLVLEKDAGSMAAMELQKPFLSSQPANSEPVAMSWTLKDRGTAFRPPDAAAADGSWLAWDLDSCEDLKNYTLECNVSPTAYQAPGDYGASFRLKVLPLNEGFGGRQANITNPQEGGGEAGA